MVEEFNDIREANGHKRLPDSSFMAPSGSLDARFAVTGTYPSKGSRNISKPIRVDTTEDMGQSLAVAWALFGNLDKDTLFVDVLPLISSVEKYAKTTKGNNAWRALDMEHGKGATRCLVSFFQWIRRTRLAQVVVPSGRGAVFMESLSDSVIPDIGVLSLCDEELFTRNAHNPDYEFGDLGGPYQAYLFRDPQGLLPSVVVPMRHFQTYPMGVGNRTDVLHSVGNTIEAFMHAVGKELGKWRLYEMVHYIQVNVHHESHIWRAPRDLDAYLAGMTTL